MDSFGPAARGELAATFIVRRPQQTSEGRRFHLKGAAESWPGPEVKDLRLNSEILKNAGAAAPEIPWRKGFRGIEYPGGLIARFFGGNRHPGVIPLENGPGPTERPFGRPFDIHLDEIDPVNAKLGNQKINRRHRHTGNLAFPLRRVEQEARSG